MLTRKTTVETIVYWLPAVAWMAGIFVLSAQPGEDVARRAEAIENAAPWQSLGSFIAHPVTVHIAEYALLAGLLALALKLSRVRPRMQALVAIAVSVLYAGSDELHQAFVPGRSASVTDFGFDALGAFIGVAAAFGIGWSLKFLRSNGPPEGEPS